MVTIGKYNLTGHTIKDVIKYDHGSNVILPIPNKEGSIFDYCAGSPSNSDRINGIIRDYKLFEVWIKTN